jgi:hypothetical protein
LPRISTSPEAILEKINEQINSKALYQSSPAIFFISGEAKSTLFHSLDIYTLFEKLSTKT